MIQTRECGVKQFFILILILIFTTDIAILLNVPFLREILGFFSLTILPGLLAIQTLKLNQISPAEKLVLSIGLSISFLMFFGLLINNLSLNLGYQIPLSTTPLLISLNIAFIAFAIIGYSINKNKIYLLPDINLTTYEKLFLIVPILFPALGTYGMHIMNGSNNNSILMLLLFLIPTYITFVCFFNNKFPSRLYPVLILSISISLLLLMSLRSNHLMGIDTHMEYFFFQTTLSNLYWDAFGNSVLDTCLAISLLPTIYQSILNTNPEFLFKILFSLLFSISPLAIYILSKRYVGDLYGFLSSFFFMSASNFLMTPIYARTNIAILFFVILMMSIFNNKIDALTKRILFIVFITSIILSHYSTTYLLFLIFLGTFIAVEIISKKLTLDRRIRGTTIVLLFTLIFLWHSLLTGATFSYGVMFIEHAIQSLTTFFMPDSRGLSVRTIFGESIWQKTIPFQIEFIFTWLTFAFIGVGIVTLLMKYKEMSFPELIHKKKDFLKQKFEVEYSVIALVFAALFLILVVTPYLSVGYSLERTHFLGIVVLSVFFVIGGVIISRYLKVRPYLTILFVLIPYFLLTSGAMYQMFDVPRMVTLNSEGKFYDMYYISDQESYGAKWLKLYNQNKKKVYTDFYGRFRLMSQAGFPPNSMNGDSITKHEKIDGYIFLRHYNIINDKLVGRNKSSQVIMLYNKTEFDDIFIEMRSIYDNGGSEVYK